MGGWVDGRVGGWVSTCATHLFSLSFPSTTHPPTHLLLTRARTPLLVMRLLNVPRTFPTSVSPGYQSVLGSQMERPLGAAATWV